MGLADWFSTFCGNLQISDGGTISSRYKAITRRLNKDFWDTESETCHSLYVGSYGRNTAIQGFSDLDMIFELPSSLYFQYDQHTGTDSRHCCKQYACRCRDSIRVPMLAQTGKLWL